MSKNNPITEDDKKEIKAIRNRISSRNNRKKKKEEYEKLQKCIIYLTEEINREKILIENYEKLCCPQCKLKMMEIKNNEQNKKEEQKETINNNEELVLEEENSRKNFSLSGKILGFSVALVSIIGILICLFEKQSIKNNNKLKQQYFFNDRPKLVSLRHLTNNNFEKDENIDNTNNNNNLPKPIESFMKNNLLQKCHDKYTWQRYSNIRKEKQIVKGNLVKKIYNDNSKLDNQFCIETNNIINNSYIIKNKSTIDISLLKEDNNIILNNSLSNKIISVYVKNYESLKKYDNGRSLPLQEQIATEVLKSKDGCVYLQMIILNEIINIKQYYLL